jgi:hypothetical protein
MKVLFFSFITLLAAMCSGGNSASVNESNNADYETVSKVESATPTEIDDTANRKMIWKGNLEIKVNNVDETTKKVNEICAQYGAFVSGMELNNSNYEISNRITLRVESKNFAQLIEAIKAEGTYVRNVTISSNDVTEKFIDVESRLKTKKEVRQRYIDILKNKTGKISEVLEAEEAIRKITEEIEAKEGQLRYLQDQVKYSTLTLRLYETVTYNEEPEVYEKSFGSKSLQALKNGWNIVTTLVLIFINIWPFILIAAVFIWRWKWIKSKLSKKRQV